ncbi:MAG: hypothetical protein ACR2L1_03025 [Pyrinomonadaceae bacterium]
MELVFTNSQMGKSESALTSDGIKVTLVHRTKSNIIVYYGKNLIAECGNRELALDAVTEHIRIAA